MAQMGEVFIVDDDSAVRDALSLVLSLEGYHVRGFSDGAAFLSVARTHVPACIVLDVHMPGRSGLDILKELEADRYPAPIFVISGQGDIPMAVDAIRHGALDFIEKPFEDDVLIEAIKRAAERISDMPDGETDLATIRARIGQLTERERQVLAAVVAGLPNKTIAYDLDISPRTVEVHRANVMAKMQARSLPELVRMTLATGLENA